MIMVGVDSVYGGKNTAIHFINCPSYNEPGFYRQTTSRNAFRRRMSDLLTKIMDARNKNYNTTKSMRWISIHNMNSFEWNINCMVNTNIGHPYEGLPILKHKSMWDFYTAIGYDYKKKKFI